MIQKFVNAYMENKEELEMAFAKDPEGYSDLIRTVVSVIASGLDAERIHKIDDGDYQGTLVFIIGETGYQPHEYYYVKVAYGSCSGCDTLEHLRDEPKEDRIKGYMTLALHIVQKLKAMGDEEV